MSKRIYEFLKGAQLVTAHVLYHRPLAEGQKPISIKSPIIGEKPKEFSHSPIIQEFYYQKDDCSDIKDKRLIDVFANLVLANNGIINIADRSKRLSVMTDFAKASDLDILPLTIPRKVEEIKPEMQDITRTFKTMVPFPKLRQFLQYWQDNIDGPLHQVQIMCGSVVKSKLGAHREFMMN